MYICICHGVNDKTIRNEARCGRGSLSDLKKNFGVGDQCGQCVHAAQKVVLEETPISELLKIPFNKKGFPKKLS